MRRKLKEPNAHTQKTVLYRNDASESTVPAIKSRSVQNKPIYLERNAHTHSVETNIRIKYTSSGNTESATNGVAVNVRI